MTETQLAEPGSQNMLLATFFVRDALCALDAAGVQEVIRVDSVTPVRHAPDQVVGVINLRGKIVTLLDPGIILGFGKSKVTRESRIFIMEDRNEFLGVLVDRADEVIQVERGGEQPLPANIPASQARFFERVCRAGGHVIAVLKPHEILNDNRPPKSAAAVPTATEN
jgi:purine-binding chemotaxis protein CheW